MPNKKYFLLKKYNNKKLLLLLNNKTIFFFIEFPIPLYSFVFLLNIKSQNIREYLFFNFLRKQFVFRFYVVIFFLFFYDLL